MGRTGCVVLALVAAVIVAVAAVAVVLLLTREPAPTTVDDAVAVFREELAGRSPVEWPVPEGVYVYATDGFERTDALTGVTNQYPSRSTITIVRAECGFTMRWDVLEGRSTTWTVCVELHGWRLASQDERHTFFGRTERTTYTCVDTPFLPLVLDPGTTVAVRCTTGSSEERGSVRVLGEQTLRVGRDDVDVVVTRRATTLTGATRGRTTHDLWIGRATGLPVLLEMRTRTANDAPVGEVRYEEDVSLRLESLEPRR